MLSGIPAPAIRFGNIVSEAKPAGRSLLEEDVPHRADAQVDPWSSPEKLKGD